MRQIDLLIYCDSPNQGEQLVSQTRTLGVALNHHVVSSSYDFSVAAQSRQFQFALVTITSDRPNLDEINTSSGMVIIALIEQETKTTASDLIKQGATDAVNIDDIDYFKHILKTQINLFFTKKQLALHHSRLEEAQQQLSVLLQSTTQPIAFIHEGFHVFANPAYLALLGYNKLESLQATLFLDLIRTDHQQAITEAMHSLEQHPSKATVFATTFVSQDEDELAYQVLLSPSRFDSEPAIQVILDKPLQTLDTPVPVRPAQRVIPLNDPVTQLYAEHHMLKLLSDTIEYSRKNNTQYMLYLIHLETGPDDVDYTNRCMQEAALKLDEKINENDVLGHFSNNSFLLLSSYDRHKNPGVYAQQLRQAIGNLDNLLLGLTHSRIAGVIIDAYCKDSEDALARLKDNFFEAQEYHDNIKIDTAQFIHAPGSQLMDQVWARKVSTILKDNRLTLLSNPIISLKHDDYERFTLELRLNDEDGVKIPIETFTNTVKQTGLSSSVDRWIIFNAAKQLVERLQNTPTTQFFIPLIGELVLEDGLFPWIEKVIKQFKLPAGSLSLQTSVDTALEFPEAFSEFSQQMAAINCHIYLTGMDDPTITHELYNNGKNTIKYLALDKKLLDGITTDRAKCQEIEVLVDQCHAQNTLTIVPEVIEPETLSELWQLGVDLVISHNLIDASDDVIELDLTATLSA